MTTPDYDALLTHPDASDALATGLALATLARSEAACLRTAHGIAQVRALYREAMVADGAWTRARRGGMPPSPYHGEWLTCGVFSSGSNPLLGLRWQLGTLCVEVEVHPPRMNGSDALNVEVKISGRHSARDMHAPLCEMLRLALEGTDADVMRAVGLVMRAVGLVMVAAEQAHRAMQTPEAP